MIEKRKEYKFLLNNSQVGGFLQNFENKLMPLYPKRTITSLYFDTVDFFLFNNSRLNDTNKVKVRIRTYSNESNFFKEIKLNDSFGKRKIVENLKINSFDKAKKINYKNLILIPSVYTSYNREYYSFEDLRITVDNEIKFTSHKKRTLSKIENQFSKSVIEFKLGKESVDVERYFILNPVAFSKYQTAISNIYNL